MIATRSWVVWAVLCVASLANAQQAFIELDAPRPTCFVHEPVELVLRFGVEAELLEERVLQPFRMGLDVPVEVRSQGLLALPGLRTFSAQETDGVTFAMNGARVFARRVDDREADGRRFRVFEHTLGVLFSAAGELTLPAPSLHLVYASGFRDDFLEGRVAVDPKQLVVVAEPQSLSVEPLPTRDQPADFSGAVGSFDIDAELRTPSVELGSSARVALTLRGTGDLTLAQPPSAELAGFHAFGLLDELVDTPAGPARRGTYDLAPLDVELDAVPPLRFVYFDPGTAEYRTSTSAALPLEVRPGPGGERTWRIADAAQSEPPRDEEVSMFPWARFGLVALILALASIVAAQRRRVLRTRSSATPRVQEVPKRRPSPATEPTRLLSECIAERWRVSPAAVIDPGLARRLVASGVPAELAERTASLLEALVAARYGGPRVEDAEGRASALVVELERTFESR